MQMSLRKLSSAWRLLGYIKSYTSYNCFPARHLHFSLPAEASFESSSSHQSLVGFVTIKTKALVPVLKRFQDQLHSVQHVVLFSWLKTNMLSWFPCWLRKRPCIGFIRLSSLWILYKVFLAYDANERGQISYDIQLSLKPTYNHYGPSHAFRAQDYTLKGEFLRVVHLGAQGCNALTWLDAQEKKRKHYTITVCPKCFKDEQKRKTDLGASCNATRAQGGAQ